MSQQLQITGGAKVRDLQDVIIGTSGVLSSLAFNVANGVPKLDVNGKILVSQLPNSVMEYQGTWNAATNTPTLVNGVGNQGDVYLCNVAGTTNFGAGPITFAVGDSAIYSGTIWQRAGGATGTVTSVGLSTSGNAFTIGSSPVTTSGTITINGSGTSGQYINGAGNLTTFPTLISSIGLSMPSAFNVSNSPLTANGTIAVTGAGYPSQYIRGDGTLADFPSSGGGGSSVSYYLNGGTSQGTIGGVTYYEMSKTADTGTGVDFPKSGDGLIVSFLTDAGDPAQLNIPAGNWNYEIYASMSANGGTPQMYAELYKYDGTTFTLIATSSNEILYDGVNLNLYTFAMTVPATTLALTDRLAVKLYATNSGGKTTTVHTQDSHLCQVITTFSTGITALNGLTAQVQYFATGTSGTDFNISSTTATHTFNIPDASATARGLITTGTQTIAGGKTFSGYASFTSTSGTSLQYGAVIQKGFTPLVFGSNITNIYSDVTTNNLVIRDNLSIANLVFNNSTQTYTFPAASGTIALLEGSQTFSGAKTFSSSIFADGSILLKNNVTSWQTGYVNLGGIATGYGFSVGLPNGGSPLVNELRFNSSAAYNYTFPAATGTLALTSDLGSYVPTTRTISTTAPLQGGGDLSANRTLSITQATTSTNGYLSSTDWTTFNNKLSTATAASTYVPYTGATGAVNLGAYDLTINGLTVGKGGGNVAVNTVLGYQALNSGTSTQNDQNTAIGYKALFSNTIGQYNTSVGYQSLYSNVNGYSNSALGWYSLYFNTGANNTANGYRSSYANTTGAGNSAFGTNALDQNSTGQNNTSLGYYSGYGTGTNYNTTGSNNIFIGYQSVGESSTASNRTWIGNTSTTSTWLGGNLLLGTRTDSGYRLDVSGTGRFSGDVLFNSAIQLGASSYIYGSVANGFRVLNNANTVALLTIANSGAATFSNTTSGNALRLFTSYASGRALNFGFSDGSVLPTAAFYIGNQTGVGVFIGDETTTNGLYVKSNGNVGIGISTPPSRLSVQWDRSTAFSGLGVYDSQAYNASNHGGTITFGGTFNSGGSYTEWSGIGGNKENTTDGDYSGNLIFYTRPNGSGMTERMRITSGGQVNVNSTQTTYPFYVQAALGNWTSVFENTANGGSGILMRSTGGSQGYYYGAYDGGAYKFFVNGSGVVNSTSTSITIISSDIKLKTDIRDYNKGLAEVLAMKPRIYKRKDNLEIDEVGFIAQEMDIALAGSMIESYKNEEGEPIHTYQLEWYPLLVKAIQEQQATITSLQDRLDKAGL